MSEPRLEYLKRAMKEAKSMSAMMIYESEFERLLWVARVAAKAQAAGLVMGMALSP
jgi:hypothetical protein